MNIDIKYLYNYRYLYEYRYRYKNLTIANRIQHCIKNNNNVSESSRIYFSNAEMA